jgi:hypothetical protein
MTEWPSASQPTYVIDSLESEGSRTEHAILRVSTSRRRGAKLYRTMVQELSREVEQIPRARWDASEKIWSRAWLKEDETRLKEQRGLT